jgi:hypothetical protein
MDVLPPSSEGLKLFMWILKGCKNPKDDHLLDNNCHENLKDNVSEVKKKN